MRGAANRLRDNRLHYLVPNSPAAAFRPHVLLAEDDREFLEFLGCSLESYGFEVTACRSGLELGEVLVDWLSDRTAHPVDVVVSDIRMPGYNGLEILEALRELDSQLPVVLMTAFTDENTVREADRLRASTVLSKPFDVDECVDAIRRCLAHPMSLDPQRYARPIG